MTSTKIPGAMTCPRCGFVLARAPRPLAPRQAEMLRFITRSIDTHGVAPSYDELRVYFGYKSLATVHEHLKVLEAKGWIRRTFNAARGIEVLHRLPGGVSDA